MTFTNGSTCICSRTSRRLPAPIRITSSQIRDWYGDFYLDDHKELRIRVGQSKVPYGWENLQSSSNRIPLDRADALNSAVRNERDLGVYFFYTPTWAQDFFKDVLEKGLKGSGNYGLLSAGVYNGQGGSLNEINNNVHVFARLALPLTFENGQNMELGIQGYTGKYAVINSAINPPGPPPAGTLPDGTVSTSGLGSVRTRLRIAMAGMTNGLRVHSSGIRSPSDFKRSGPSVAVRL